MNTILITRIEVAGRDGRARRLYYDTGFGPRITSAAVLRRLSIEVGDSVDLDELCAVEADSARDRALKYLGYRDRTEHEIVQRLTDDGYSPELADSVRQKMSELGFIDDHRLAHDWAQSRSGSGWGPRRILQDLARRGIPCDLAADAVSTLSGGAEESARRALRGKTAVDRKERDRLVRRLVSRGFDISTALRVTEGSCETWESDHDD